VPIGPKVALLSTERFFEWDEDLPGLVDELRRLDVDVTVADWHDAGCDWSAFELVVIRSTWDYTDDPNGYLQTLERIAEATRLANPLPAVVANVDKAYLVRLLQLGAPVVPTTVLAPGDPVVLPAGVAVVVKPTVSAGARDTERYDPDDEAAAQAHVERLHAAGRSVLVQPYVDAVDDRGETGLVYVGDRFSHAFRKGALLTSDAPFVENTYREETIEPRTPTAEELDVAEGVLDLVGDLVPGCSRTDLVYARVDLVPGPGGPLLMELELIEPSLFLPTSAGAAARAASAIAAAAVGQAGADAT
jgi:glutathione synthase/RimK-type ligase-like ATP-grasp enzyme